MDNGFIIAEFHDGLQLIPTAWYNKNNSSSIWPSHFKTKLRINKAIVTKEMPRDKSDWEELSIKKIFGTADTYEKGMVKLVRAEDTSNVDTTVSSNELRNRKKQMRRLKAKKQLSSSSSDELSSFEDKENSIQKDKILPALPQKDHFVSNKKYLPSTSIQNKAKILRENTSFIINVGKYLIQENTNIIIYY
ncbi:hypothetical protein ALC60_02143 [Trachymyrmex zeteki]|uniref:Uncharacterized protein n=1 Tax=Mycetomoellerius zeteki TaxID=64791 RepID=A0A151XEU8_9HYME|nr:hypothetical protein ALC60_02143 [Trachymyrmex zeteki]